MSATGEDRFPKSREAGWVAAFERGWALVFLRDWHPVLRDPSTSSA